MWLQEWWKWLIKTPYWRVDWRTTSSQHRIKVERLRVKRVSTYVISHKIISIIIITILNFYHSNNSISIFLMKLNRGLAITWLIRDLVNNRYIIINTKQSQTSVLRSRADAASCVAMVAAPRSQMRTGSDLHVAGSRHASMRPPWEPVSTASEDMCEWRKAKETMKRLSNVLFWIMEIHS